MRQRLSRELSAMSASPVASPFLGSFTLPSFCSSTLFKLPALLRQCLNVRGHGVRATALQTLAPLVLHVMAGPSACWVSKAESFGWGSSGFWISYCPTAVHCAGLCVDKNVAIKLNDWCNLILIHCICLQLSTSTTIFFSFQT